MQAVHRAGVIHVGDGPAGKRSHDRGRRHLAAVQGPCVADLVGTWKRANTLDRGGHFAAWEQPDLFSAEMRASFKTLR